MKEESLRLLDRSEAFMRLSARAGRRADNLDGGDPEDGAAGSQIGQAVRY